MDFQVHITLPVTLDKHGCDTTAAGWTQDAPPELTGLSCALCHHFPDGCSSQSVPSSLKQWCDQAPWAQGALVPGDTGCDTSYTPQRSG